ncbi:MULTISPECIES: hypothetical protein [Okeania]|uniref:Uncharacterized protein n=1 Tax=Okeania hirsuta TaxID=1458930 RepID=A0A3N6PGF2_9CYAN|nr:MULTISPECIES: hypothetical protein [Okeania]NET14907.1 hypothetical protein [Okeania sp. SIO1H6]NEP75554.1 hypothetical protein [Okeania sp. SIO2G5]NEP96690.1 hypothetical protein [Okeania sp. SIO2F5]NEQ94400.1 hypothetical protein [Okeania sp. SIO2G4]NES77192.1 hypothetical protein [Okeania sp. SIO1H4]
MMISKDIMEQVTQSYKVMLAYHQQVGSLFKVLDNRFASEHNAKKFLPISLNKLFSVCDDEYMFLDNYTLLNRKEPYDSGLPFWLGRFYVNADYLVDDTPIDDYPAKQVQYIAFVWVWVGCDDPNVVDVDEPECWIAIIEPKPTHPETRIYDVAEMIWKWIRIETTAEEESDGWIVGRFSPNDFGSELNGFWHVKRFPLKDISSIYHIYKLIINPLTEKLAQLEGGKSIR